MMNVIAMVVPYSIYDFTTLYILQISGDFEFV